MTRHEREGVNFVRFHGHASLDEDEVLALQQSLLPPASQGTPVKVVLNLEGIQLVRTAAWGKLMLFHQQVVKDGGQVKLCGLEATVKECLEVMKLHRLFDVAPTEHDAEREMRTQA